MVAQGIRREDRSYLPLTPAVLAAHLKGEVHIGLYPLLDGDKCWWLAADFDGPEAMFDALMYVKVGRPLAGTRRAGGLQVRRRGTRVGCSSPPRFRPRWPVGWVPGCCARQWRCAGG